MSFGNVLCSMACLYGAVFLMYGMLSIQRGAFHERKQKLVNLYGHPIEEAQGSPQARFFKAFCLRPTFLTGLFIAVIIIRWYNRPIPSMVMAALFGGYMLSIFRSLETKFIPGTVIFCSVVYFTFHLVGYMNGWNPTILPKNGLSEDVSLAALNATLGVPSTDTPLVK